MMELLLTKIRLKFKDSSPDDFYTYKPCLAVLHDHFSQYVSYILLICIMFCTLLFYY